MNDQKVDYKNALGIEWVLTAETIIAVLGIFVAIWMWGVTS